MNPLAIPIRQTGFTLLELLLAIAVAAVLLQFATASMRMLRAELQLNTTVNHVVHALHSARLTALRTGSDVIVCPSPDGRRCAPGADWGSGWLAFENRDSSTNPQPDSGERIMRQADSLRDITIRANRRHFVLRPFGRRSTNGTLVFCDARGARAARAIILSYTGKPRVSRRTAGGGALRCSV